MAYAASGLSLGLQLIGGHYRIWVYTSTDPFSTVDDTDYFAVAGIGTGGTPGMREGDFVFVVDTDSDPPDVTMAYVSAIDADFNATVSAVAFAGASVFTTLNVSGATTLDGAVALGNAAADVVAFHGATGSSQPASSVEATSNIASSTDFGATQLAVVQAIMTCLTNHGLWKGTA